MANPTPTKQEISKAIGAYLDAVKTMAEAIRTAGPDGMPSGHLYAYVCGAVDLPTYNRMIDTLKGAKLVAERNHVLTWIGPQIEG